MENINTTKAWWKKCSLVLINNPLCYHKKKGGILFSGVPGRYPTSTKRKKKPQSRRSDPTLYAVIIRLNFESTRTQTSQSRVYRQLWAKGKKWRRPHPGDLERHGATHMNSLFNGSMSRLFRHMSKWIKHVDPHDPSISQVYGTGQP